MKDQEFAIHWVHNNAAAFGGDASRLMMFGCSAGGASVAGHLVNRRMNGLYSSAALHSPGGHQGWQSPTSVGVDDWMSKKTNLHNSKVFAARLGYTTQAAEYESGLHCPRNDHLFCNTVFAAACRC